MNKYSCYLIGNRYPNLTSSNLEALEKWFEIHHIEPIMTNSESSAFLEVKNKKEFYCFQGRDPLPGEIGCAKSHLNVYSKIINNKISWALILEDDAEILNSTELFQAIHAFVSDDVQFPAVYSLYTENFPAKNLHLEQVEEEFIKTKIAPPTTVAYLINNQAARLFLQIQNPIKFVADWPFTGDKCRFYLTTRSLFLHHNTNSSIVVSKDTNRELRVHRKIAIWSLFWFVKNHRLFGNLPRYFEMMIKPRYLYHTRNLRDFSGN
jgi:GR25 family glycosyltransferase involved in LPS biosynthesis